MPGTDLVFSATVGQLDSIGSKAESLRGGGSPALTLVGHPCYRPTLQLCTLRYCYWLCCYDVTRIVLRFRDALSGTDNGDAVRAIDLRSAMYCPVLILAMLYVTSYRPTLRYVLCGTDIGYA
eukprot:3825325-Rhodomonas_salina.2